ncbi:MAG: asnB 2 [Magnetococcales bacterium]|nr:asnB 2 [Magnetococcales bacterium]
MCGIAGMVSQKHDRARLQTILKAMNRALAHRGPDGEGIFVADGVGLAHRRLAIIDLTDAGHQPMVWQQGHLVIVYNGEVYNYIELRQSLEKLGHVFQGHSDTEVVLHAYGQWGRDAFSMFNGMFALAIYDTVADKLVLVRDRVGIKPLFYRHVGGEFAFASELKAFFQLPDLGTRLDADAFYHYLVYNTPPCPSTLLSEVRQLPPGCIMELDAGRKATLVRFWEPPPYDPDGSITMDQAAEEVEMLLRDAVRLRLRSDVPVGVFLSGGIDSSLLTALACPMVSGLKTFSAGYGNDPSDESHFAAKVAQHLGTEHQTITIDPADLNPKNFIRVADDPLANVTIVPYLKLAEATRRHIKVVLAGDGGDEFFAGYDVRHLYAKIVRAKKIIGTPLWNAGVALGQGVFRSGTPRRILNLARFSSPLELLALFQAGIPLQQISALIAQPHATTLPPHYALQGDGTSFLALNRQTISSYLTDTVLKTSDRVTMAHGLEARVPLTDYRIMEFAARLPESLQFHQRQGKAILKRILYKHVPKHLVDRPKQGFSVPGHRWFTGPWKGHFYETLSPSRVQRSGLLHGDVVTRMLADYQGGRREYSALLWRLLVFQWWYEHWIQGGVG